ncbi:hypothetical protein NHQ30_009348 [Ciborinia camelliae]|nr:hypothetical protein NHQ30_009348 [Ciborinia camelliae]
MSSTKHTQLNSQMEGDDKENSPFPSFKRSRSPSPDSITLEAPPLKRQMTSRQMTSRTANLWIDNSDIFHGVQEKLSLYGLGPYDLPVASEKWLSFNLQHDILTHTQSVLEAAMFEFLQENFPHVCEENEWEEAKEAELNGLAPVILALVLADTDGMFHDVNNFNMARHIKRDLSLRTILEKIGQIQHCAVHRTKRIPIIILELMVCDAVYIIACLHGLSNPRTMHLNLLRWRIYDLSHNLEMRFGDDIKGVILRDVKRVVTEIKKMTGDLKKAEMDKIKAEEELKKPEINKIEAERDLETAEAEIWMLEVSLEFKAVSVIGQLRYIKDNQDETLYDGFLEELMDFMEGVSGE